MTQLPKATNTKGRGKSSVRLSKEKTKMVNQARIRKGWNKTEPAWHDLAGVSLSTLKRFLNGEGVTIANFRSLSEVVGIKDWYSLIDWEQSDSAAVAQVMLESNKEPVFRTSNSAENAVTITGVFDAYLRLEVEMTSERLIELLHDGKLSIKQEANTLGGVLIQGIYSPEKQLQIETVLYHLQKLLISCNITIADSSLEIKSFSLPNAHKH